MNNNENHERLTRKQYREQQQNSKNNFSESTENDLDDNNINLEMDQERKSSRHDRISKKLNWIILYLCMGIVIVFLILFFFNP
ncbi:hypothetical protein [Apilactobacillus xinyiensis]|jgi:hypothetical protein|uniref:Uncharacterized protein n=1 Tax=Apilactobacillus xinyiensis TaxID=2841032 RepID=A0ABT0I205_9LACO|nr:hypothetical protein [Apilactobacillus xinyiensis]MCK8624741.1 hypothetical protein [Apilactobacillus xinyiensis]MCL0312408.1 hypothetical protein [Apilactobacillus xinyiensis]MCL0318856.1 hypothetical protein [Apilactobacillus xinyiensis]